MNFDQAPKTPQVKEDIQKTINHLLKFNDEELMKWNENLGYTEYDKENFQKYTRENEINVGDTLDSYMDKINLSEAFSENEIKYIESFRAWLHCDFENAKKYIIDKFDFRCENNKKFTEKLRFFNTIAYFIFEHESTTYRNKELEEQEKFIFNSLKEETIKNNGSFLLNYLSEDYISVIEHKKTSVEEEKDIDWVPFKIAPKVYAFDSSDSVFALINKNNLNHDNLYISNEKDFEKIDPIIKSFKENKSLTQEYFDDLVNYFSPLDTKNLTLNSKSKNIDGAELYLFRKLHTKYHRSNIKEKTGVELSEIPLTEQRYFVDYLKFVDYDSVDYLKDFNKKYKKNGFQTFLSIEHGGKEMGNKILELGEKLPEEIARKVFAKFGEIIDSVDEVISIIGERFGKDTKDPTLFDSVRKTLLKKGSDLLVEYSSMASKCEGGKECNEIGKEILEKLENSKHSAILLGSAFKSVLSEGISLEQIKDVTLESTNDREKISEYKEEMLKIFEANRATYPKELLKETMEEFKEALNTPENKEFFILKDKEDILGFMRFDKLENGNLYAGSLNTRNEIHGLAIGGALLKDLLIKKSKENNIEAVVYENNPMLEKYVTEYGFKIIGEIENYKGTGQKFYKIEIQKGDLNSKN